MRRHDPAREHLDLMTVPYEFIDVDEDDQAAEHVEEWNGGTRSDLTLWRALTRASGFAD